MQRNVISSGSQVDIEPVSNMDVGRLATPSDRQGGLYENFFKRPLDICLVALILPIIAVPLLILFLLVRRDGGPFLYGHERIGLDGKPFKCLKIRTMVVDADRKLQAILDADPALRREWETHFKLKKDPRISGVGGILRATSLDEFPQFFNVLRGDMSIVGPRPIVQEELERFGPLGKDYIGVRPGLTGLWQIKGRRDNDYTHRAQMDAAYARNISFLRDIYIMFATVPEVLLARGR